MNSTKVVHMNSTKVVQTNSVHGKVVTHSGVATNSTCVSDAPHSCSNSRSSSHLCAVNSTKVGVVHMNHTKVVHMNSTKVVHMNSVHGNVVTHTATPTIL